MKPIAYSRILIAQLLYALTFFAGDTLALAEKLPFTIPARPLGTEQRIKEINENAITDRWHKRFRDEAFDECPATAKVLYKIKDRIEKENSLGAFGPYKHVSLVIKCWGTPLRWQGETTADGAIVLDRRWLNLVDTEDELAFTISHEYSHLLLGHEELQNFSPKSEADADQLGSTLSVNAGYDPTASRHLFCAMERNYQQVSEVIPCEKLNRADRTHGGTIDQRSRRIEAFLASVHFVSGHGMKDTEDLKKAKAEVKCLDAGLSPICTDIRSYLDEVQKNRKD